MLTEIGKKIIILCILQKYTDAYHPKTQQQIAEKLRTDYGLLFSRSVPYKQRRQLTDKPGKLSGSYFSRRMNHVRCISPDSPQHSRLFHTVDILDEAITEGKQVRIE